jgi:predicted peroxiredoxin/TusA-related sulfurtransferase
MFKLLSIVALASLVIGCATHNQHSEALTMGKIPSNRSIDMRGKTITPFILYYAVKNLQDMQEGEILEVNTDKFEAIENDMNAWSRMTGHRLLEMETSNNYQRYFIEKVNIKKPERILAMIISDPGLEKLLSPLGLALSAALSGTDVYLYFQGPAVRVLKKNFKAKLSGIQKPLSSFARKEMAKAGHLPPQDKLEQLKELGARIYICGGSMNPFGVKKSDLVFDDVIVAEYLTFLEIMDNADIHIFLQ